jgi:hypothetical protein
VVECGVPCYAVGMDDLPPGLRKAPPPPARSQVMPSFNTSIQSWMIPVIEKAVRAGLPIKLCAGLIGIAPRTLTRWRELGQQDNCPDPLLVELSLTVEKARAEAALAGVELMQMHAARDWKAAHALLQAQDPDTWSPQSKSKVELEVKVAETEDLSMLTDEELEMRARIEEKVRAKRLPA